MKKFLLVLAMLLLFILVGISIFILPLSTCQLGVGNPFNNSYALPTNVRSMPGSIIVSTTKCSLFQAFRHDVIVVKM